MDNTAQTARHFRTGDEELDLLIGRANTLGDSACGTHPSGDQLPERGFAFHPGRPTSVLIAGGPGCGKSILAGQIAYSYARDYPGSLVLYVTMEEYTWTVGDRIRFFAPRGEHACQPEVHTAAQLQLLERVSPSHAAYQKAMSGLRDRGGIFMLSANAPALASKLDRYFTRQEGDPQCDTATDTRCRTAPDERIDEICANIRALDGILKVLSEKVPARDGSHNLNLLVLDSLNGFTGPTDALTSGLRTDLRIVFDQLNEIHKYNAVFTFEESAPGAIEEFLADAVLRLRSTHGEIPRRSLSLLKVRDQPSSPVSHDFQIVPGHGIRVTRDVDTLFPAGGAVDALPEAPREGLRFGLPNLDNQLSVGLFGSVHDRSGEVSGLRPGSCTLIAGGPGCRKTHLALTFIHQALELRYASSKAPLADTPQRESDGPGGEFGVYVALQDPESTLRRAERMARSCLDAASVEVQLGPTEGQVPLADDAGPCFLLVPDLPQHVSELAHSIRLRIEGIRRVVGGPSRLAINDLSALFAAYGERDTIQLVRAVRRMCSRYRIALLLVHTTTSLDDRVVALATNVIQCEQVGERGRRGHIAVRVRKYEGGAGHGVIQEILVDPETYRIDVQPGVFKDAVELEGGRIGVGRVRVYHYYGENERQNELFDWMQRALSVRAGDERATEGEARAPELVKFGPHYGEEEEWPEASDFIRGMLWDVPAARSHLTEVIMFDEPWIERLRGRLHDLRLFVADPGDNWVQRRRANAFDPGKRRTNQPGYSQAPRLTAFVEGQHLPPTGVPGDVEASQPSPDESGSPLYGIPYIIDFSCLCYRRDLIKACYTAASDLFRGSESVWEKVTPETGIISDEADWRDILTIGRAVSAVAESNPQPLFIDAFSNESICSFFLELLSKYVFSSGISHRPHIALCNTFENGTFAQMAEEVKTWAELASSDARVNFVTPPRRHPPEFVFARTWQKTAMELLWRANEGGNGAVELGFAAIPPLKGTIAEGISLSGNWFLGLMSHSQNPARGAGIIRRMTSRESQQAVFSLKAGFPSYHWYWQEWAYPTQQIEVYTKARSRCEIISHHLHVEPLAHAFREALEKPNMILDTMEKLRHSVQVVGDDHWSHRTAEPSPGTR